LNLLEGSDSAGVESPTESEDVVSPLLARRHHLLQQAFAGITLRSLALPHPTHAPQADTSASPPPSPAP
jgi:hypothetical protein